MIAIERKVRITEREQEVLELLSRGLTTKEIANELFLSTHTVESHKKNMKEKLSAKNVIDLVVNALRSELI